MRRVDKNGIMTIKVTQSHIRLQIYLNDFFVLKFQDSYLGRVQF